MLNSLKGTPTFLLGTLALTLLFVVSGFDCDCNKSVGPESEEVNTLPTLEEMKSSVSVAVNDAAKGSPISLSGNDDVILKITGASSNLIYNTMNEKKSLFSGKKGVFSFYVKASTFPVTLTLVSQSEGYITSGKTVDVGLGSNMFTIEMVKINEPPQSVAVVEEKITTDTNGEIQNSITIETPKKSATSGKTIVEIPAQTIIRDENGSPLTGNINTVVTYHDNLDEEALSTFPGGFSVDENTQGEAQQGILVSGGFTAVEMTDDEGKKAENFSKPVSVTMEIPASTLNPDTKTSIQNGDTIPVWSYDDETGKWSFETKTVISGPLSNGNFEATMLVTHLSYWNLDWLEFTCEYSDIILQGGEGYNLRLVSTMPNGGYIRDFYTNGESTLHLTRFGESTIKVYYGDSKVGSITPSSIICRGTVTVPINIPSELKPMPVTVIVYNQCNENRSVSKEAQGNIVEYFDSSDMLVASKMTDTDGYSAITLPDGTYRMTTHGRLAGDTTITFTFDGKPLRLDVFLTTDCKDVTGSFGE